MKTKKMLLYCCAVLMFMSCKQTPKQETNKATDESSITEKTKGEKLSNSEPEMAQDIGGRMVLIDPNNAKDYTSFKFANTASTFKVDSDYLFLEIPVSDVKLRIQDVIDISNETTNAILVWLKSDEKGARNNGQPVKGLLQTRYVISELKLDRLNKGRLKIDKKVKVYFWNNDKLTDEKKAKFREKVGEYNRLDFDCEEEPIDKSRDDEYPDEECGDILNGG